MLVYFVYHDIENKKLKRFSNSKNGKKLRDLFYFNRAFIKDI